jgi:hypothetical protein
LKVELHNPSPRPLTRVRGRGEGLCIRYAFQSGAIPAQARKNGLGQVQRLTGVLLLVCLPLDWSLSGKLIELREAWLVSNSGV